MPQKRQFGSNIKTGESMSQHMYDGDDACWHNRRHHISPIFILFYYFLQKKFFPCFYLSFLGLSIQNCSKIDCYGIFIIVIIMTFHFLLQYHPATSGRIIDFHKKRFCVWVNSKHSKIVLLAPGKATPRTFQSHV